MKEHRAIITVDLGFGDAGKGSIVDYLASKSEAKTVIRYNGGSQAAHNVVTPEGKYHIFAQFGSATFLNDVKTYLSKFMLVNPLNMLKEEEHLQALGIYDAFTRSYIDEEAVLITPFQVAVNRLKEIYRNKGKHGSCGMGIGETRSDQIRFGNDVLLAGDLKNSNLTLKKLNFIKEVQLSKIDGFRGDLPGTEMVNRELRILDDPQTIPILLEKYTNFISVGNIVSRDFLYKVFKSPGTTIFEGAQGLLLDEKYGFYPYNTWTDTTVNNANILLDEMNFQDQRINLGILRGYLTRHGAGPFVTEDPDLTSRLPDFHNLTNNWQENFRVGYFDLVAGKYALNVLGGVDGLALTCLDRLEELDQWKICTSYNYQGKTLEILKVQKPACNFLQEKLTNLLFECKPNYQILKGYDINEYISLIENELRIPITITSFGPTRKDKYERIP